jgi:hypothetical protein
MRYFLSIALAFLLAVAGPSSAQMSLSGAGGVKPVASGGRGITFQWQNTQDNGLHANNNTVNVGATSPLGSNGAFTSGTTLIAQVMLLGGTGDTIVPPAGWTLIGTQITDGNGAITAYFWHTCGGSETGSYTFTWTSNHFNSWSLVNYSGANASPIDASVTTTWGGGPTSITTSSVTTTAANDMLLLFMSGDGTTTFTKPTDMTSRIASLFFDSTNASGAMSDRSVTTATSYTETFTVNAGFLQGGYALIALKQ